MNRLSLAVAAALVLCAGAASATTINFGSYATGTAVTSADGVTFSLQGGPDSDGPPLIGYANDTPIGLSNSTNPDYPTASILNFAFSGPVSGVSFYFNNYGDNVATYYQAFNSADALVASGSLATEDGFENNIVTGSGITDIQFNNGTDGEASWYFAVNSITFSAVPEPAAWALMLVGIGALGAGLRLRRSEGLAPA